MDCKKAHHRRLNGVVKSNKEFSSDRKPKPNTWNSGVFLIVYVCSILDAASKWIFRILKRRWRPTDKLKALYDRPMPAPSTQWRTPGLNMSRIRIVYSVVSFYSNSGPVSVLIYKKDNEPVAVTHHQMMQGHLGWCVRLPDAQFPHL